MAKKQMNMFLEEELQERIRAEARIQRYDGPSELVRRDILGYLDGDLDAVTRTLVYILARANGPVDQRKLSVLKALVDSYVV